MKIRIREGGDAFRVLYVAKFEEATYVLHCFQTKTQATNQPVIGLIEQHGVALVSVVDPISLFGVSSYIETRMKKRYKKFNPKRRIAPAGSQEVLRCEAWKAAISYGGNPEHKMNPGDFGLEPPANPRDGKSLCDAAGIFSRAEALELLKAGIDRGLVSDREVNGWPKNIWSVTEKGVPMEAQLENPETGKYHGYPMPGSDPLAAEVTTRWELYG